MAQTPEDDRLDQVRRGQAHAAAYTPKLAAWRARDEAWARVPEHLREGLTRYLEQHIPTGSFLTAVLRGDLVDAVRCGDPVSLAGLVPLVQFLFEHAPPQAWGSPERVQAWLHREDA